MRQLQWRARAQRRRALRGCVPSRQLFASWGYPMRQYVLIECEKVRCGSSLKSENAHAGKVIAFIPSPTPVSVCFQNEMRKLARTLLSFPELTPTRIPQVVSQVV